MLKPPTAVAGGMTADSGTADTPPVDGRTGGHFSKVSAPAEWDAAVHENRALRTAHPRRCRGVDLSGARLMADRSGQSWRARSVVAGALFGIGVAAFLDEAIFHQLLHWHHFYDRSTSTAGLVSDGFFHAF